VGTKQNNRDTQTIDCNICGQEYTPACNWHQGRCPHHPALLEVSKITTRFINLINFFKGKQNGIN